jgi:selenocysteine lyase/cysteine desulfurase
MLDVGTAAAEAHHRALQDRAVECLAGTALRPATTLEAARRSPMLMLEPEPGLDLDGLEAGLTSRRIAISVRAGRLRLSPGIWNDVSDIDAFVDAVRAIARG